MNGGSVRLIRGSLKKTSDCTLVAIVDQEPGAKGLASALTAWLVEWCTAGFNGCNSMLVFSTDNANRILLQPSELYRSCISAVNEHLFYSQLVLSFRSPHHDASHDGLLNEVKTTAKPIRRQPAEDYRLLFQGPNDCEQVKILESFGFPPSPFYYQVRLFRKRQDYRHGLQLKLKLVAIFMRDA